MRKGWIDVDLDGLSKLLERRGKEFAMFELVQNKVRDAWAAGLVDGDGCITISKQRRPDGVYVRLRVVVSQSGDKLPRPLRVLRSRYGGSIESKSKPGGRRKPVWSWAVTTMMAQRFIERIGPYVEGKRDEVRVALAYRAAMARMPQRNPRRRATMEAFWRRMKALKNYQGGKYAI